MIAHDPTVLPDNLPIPIDDGACAHLAGMSVPNISLNSTQDRILNLQELSKERAVFYFYPRTGVPGENPPSDWDSIPGARGCTPQSCAYRDLNHEFSSLGVKVFGASTQGTEFQKEFITRNHIPFEIISDEKLELTRALKLPTFVSEGQTLIKRLALVVEKSKIIQVFYPVFPPDKNAAAVLEWLRKHP